MRNIALTIISVFLFNIALIAQTPSIKNSGVLEEGNPSEVGMSPERLARFDDMCNEMIENDNVPGIVSLVARNGKIVHWKAYGKADNKSNRKMKRDDIFRIASQTKAITSTAVMMLWEEGKFQLDDPIENYIPEFKDAQILKDFNEQDTTWTSTPAKNKITIRHLLTHTSGIGYGDIDGNKAMKLIYQKAGIAIAFSAEKITIEENIKKLAKLPLLFEPGSQYKYCMGLDVLGYFVEIISGMPFDEFLQTRLFDPLGMEDTGFYLPKSKAKRLVSIQRYLDGKWERFPDTFYETDYPVKGAKTLFSGGGGLSSTAKDYATLLQMYLNGGEYNGKRFLSRKTIETIMQNQIGDYWGEESPRGHGLAFALTNKKGVAKGGLNSEGTFTWGGYFNTQYFADPKEQTIGVIMKQTQGKVNDPSSWKYRILIDQAIDD